MVMIHLEVPHPITINSHYRDSIVFFAVRRSVDARDYPGSLGPASA